MARLLGIAMAVGSARVLRSAPKCLEAYWRTLVDHDPPTNRDSSQSQRCGRRCPGHCGQCRREGLDIVENAGHQRHRWRGQRHVKDSIDIATHAVDRTKEVSRQDGRRRLVD